MKKSIILFSLAVILGGFAACSGKVEETTSEDTTTVVAEPEPIVADTMPTDTVAVDTVAH